MTDDDWTHTINLASRSEVRRLLSQVEADERYGMPKVYELLNSFQVRSIAELSEEQLRDMRILCERLFQDKAP